MKIRRYVEFIRESRRRGFGDLTIRNALIDKGWPLNEINLAFNYVQTLSNAYKEESMDEPEENKVTIYLDNELLDKLDKRAKKNMLTLPEQIEDILRRSTLNQKNKKSAGSEKLDDNLVGLFSRKKTGPKSKKKKKKNVKKEKRKEIRKARRHKRKIVKEKKKAEKIEKKVKRKSRRHKKKER